MARVTLDLDALVQRGDLTADEASRLERLAEPSRALNRILTLLVVFGALGVVAAVLALEPSLELGLTLALAALGGAIVIRQTSLRENWGLLMQALALLGALGVSAYLILKLEGSSAAHFGAFLITGAAAWGFRNGLLAAAAVLTLGAMIGSGTGYWHAGYALFVREATLTALLFGGLSAGFFWARDRIPAAHEMLATVIARTSFFLANFGFWVGSLWGDYPGEHWAAGDRWRAAVEWRDAALHIPEAVFSLAWAAFLIAGLVIGVRTQRRFLANTAIVFLAIHAYTQFFEVLGAHPWTLLLAGLSLIGVGVGAARFDHWQRNRAAA